MRKSLILTLVLLVLAIGGGIAVHAAVNAAQDDVAITETVVAGDPAAAEGVRVQLRTKCAAHLLWETHYAVGAPDGTYTDFTFSYPALQDSEAYYTGVQLGTISGSAGYSGNFDVTVGDDEAFAPFGVKLLRAVAENTDPGTKHTETLRVRDYYDAFPIAVSLSLSDQGDTDAQDAAWQQIETALKDFFCIPVPEDLFVRVSVQKEGDAISEMSLETLNEAAPLLWTQNVVLDGACYFTVDLRREDGEPLDTGRIPGGVGVYRLSYGGGAIGLETVFPLEPETEVSDLHASPDQSKLLLTTLEDDTYYLTVIDLETMAALQKLPLLEDAADSGWWGANYNEEFLVISFYDDTHVEFAVVSAPETGNYAVALRGTVADADQTWSLDAAMDFDGEALVVATPWWSWDDSGYYGGVPRGFWLSVYDAGGLRYSGQYGSSLMDDPPRDWTSTGDACYFTSVNGLTVMWPGAE